MDLKAYYETAFGETQGEIYGSADAWTAIQRSGHFRRMELLDRLPIPALDQAAAVDFGMGSWGFASVFPKLRTARSCVGIDISDIALTQSAAVDGEIAGKTRYFRSEASGIPLPDDSVDVFWGGEVLEHVAEPGQFLQEIARVCRDGAHVVLSTPNRDAVLYLVEGQHYAIGPEHIALLNAHELATLGDLFFVTRSIFGYETSISPDVDRALADPAVAALLQERATASPALASGLLYHGVVDKAKFRKRARRWTRADLEWTDPRVVFSQPPEPLDLSGPLRGAGLPTEGTVEAKLHGRKFVLFFWSHDWSGIARIAIGERVRDVDLFSKQSGFRRVEIEFSTSEVRPIRITRTGSHSDRSVDSQVILHSIMALDDAADADAARTGQPGVDAAIGSVVDVDFDGLQFAIETQPVVDRFISAEIRREGAWEPFESRVFKALCDPGAFVIDIGANIGWYSLIASACVGEHGHVVALEPEARNHALLRRNLGRNGTRNVDARRSAVSDRVGEGRLHLSPDNMGDHRLGEAGGESREVTAVPLIRLDALIREVGRSPALIKVDTQGSEWHVVLGAGAHPPDPPTCCWLVEFWPHGLAGVGAHPSDLLQWFAHRGYRAYVLTEADPRLIPTDSATLLGRLDTDLAEQTTAFVNLLMIHPSDPRFARIATFLS